MWYQRYCELDLPVMPTQPDTYYVDIYFNDQYVGTLNFTVTE
jgi:outer membrane usher protein FimD/PapC